MEKVTIKDVAKHAGVSVATVSRVVNNNYYVSPEVARTVVQAISELKYVPNLVARSLKKDATFSLGVLVSDITNNYFIEMAKAVEDIVSKQGYSLIVCSTENSRKRELAYLELLISRKIDGLILNTTGENDEYVVGLSRKIPVVAINRKIKDTGFRGDLVDSNSIQGAYELTTHLLDLGHRKIFVLNGSLSVSTGRERFAGFQKAMREVGIKVTDNYPYRYDGNFTLEAGYQGAAAWARLADRPTAMIVMNNMMTVGALKYIQTHGIRVPEEMSIVSYERIENIELFSVQPTIAASDPSLMGGKVAELMLERIQSSGLNNREIVFQPKLLIGNGEGRI